MTRSGNIPNEADREGAAPAKVVGLGAPISVWIYFEVSEIPALEAAIVDELARHGVAAATTSYAAEPKPGVDPADWADQIAELRRMQADLAQACSSRSKGRFDVVWPTALAHGVVHRSVAHAERRLVDTLGVATPSARDALTHARRSRDDFNAVDRGGLDSVWL